MDRILFIVPPNLDFESFINPAFNECEVSGKSGKFGSVLTDMPMGLISMSAYLKKNMTVEVKLINFNVILTKMDDFGYNSYKDFFHDVLSAKEWLDYSPTIVGISTLFTPSYYSMLDIAEAARSIFPASLIIAGGGIPTNMYKKIFEDSACFDALCYGEGERPLLGLVEAADKVEFLKNNPSWITKDDKNKFFVFDHIENLDDIPFFDYDILGTEDYQLNPLLSAFPLARRETKSMPYMSSRGCPHRCCFCASHTVHGRAMRYHSLDRLRADFKRLSEQYGIKTVVFLDDHFMADKQRVYAIIDIMTDLQLTPFFPYSLTLYALDRKVLEALKSIGLNHIILSVESGSNRVLKEIMHKPLNLSIVKRVIADCRQLGIDTDVNILIGLPGETRHDIEVSLAFLKTLDATWFRFYVATPLVGSEMYNICVENNYLSDNYLSCNLKKAVITTEDFTAEYIRDKAYSLNLELNFVWNSDLRLGNYDVALKGFENTIRVKADHAFAYYFAAKAAKMLNLDEKYTSYKAKYLEIINKSEFWRNYANQFALAAIE
ncbi:B12-binding domain-containing radical SAM protein [Candidatus Magnetomonas plexicatena]|uniref:B12-binding domain-containing radical SAM protein n=1 Tax=Candidatus Magnetomonas plexicatena TaxID=2552947 RepID=UPI001C754AE8|nr:B12-binding domain-containing radical SAM protein [Nitrospirales bacterium LBB_01]